MAQRGTTAKIDLTELEKLCSLQCTDEELAAWFGVTTRTIERKRKKKAFAEVMERGKAKGRISVRRMQMKLLEQGNATMGVWLGKNILNQVDQLRHDMYGEFTPVLHVVMPGMSASASPTALAMPRQLNEADEEEPEEIDP